MKMSTQYLGLELAHPLMPGASPLAADFDAVRRLEDAGAAAIQMHSLFEEQLVADQLFSMRNVDRHAESFAEATSYLPRPDEYTLGPEEYLEQIRKIKAAVKVPVFGSLNGTTMGGWLDYAKQIEQAGADALELNTYLLSADPARTGTEIEDTMIEMAKTVKRSVGIPVALKLSPYFSSLPHFAKRLEEAGADGLVLFNRFYQPDIDVEELEVLRTLRLSDSSELLLRLRWLAILSGRAQCSLACSGGVHTPLDAVKAVMTGAHAVQMVSALLDRGPGQLKVVLDGMRAWMEEHEYESVDQMRGSMNLMRSPNPAAYERANYIHILQGWGA